MSSNATPQQAVKDYYDSPESRLGYALLLGGTKHFGYYPEGKEQLSKRHAQHLMEDQLAHHLTLPRGARVIDAGCGEGYVATYLARHYGLRVTGVDLLDWAVQKAVAHARHEHVAATSAFQVMDYTDLAYADETFAGAYTMETLVHAPDYARALRELHRVLKPSGTLALFEYSVAPRDVMPPDLRYTWRLVEEGSGMHSLPYFIHGSFPALLTRAGFANVTVEDVTARIMPMIGMFHRYAHYPYLVIRALGLQRQFVNTTAGFVLRDMIAQDLWRYNIITAAKPA